MVQRVQELRLHLRHMHQGRQPVWRRDGPVQSELPHRRVSMRLDERGEEDSGGVRVPALWAEGRSLSVREWVLGKVEECIRRVKEEGALDAMSVAGWILNILVNDFGTLLRWVRRGLHGH